MYLHENVKSIGSQVGIKLPLKLPFSVNFVSNSAKWEFSTVSRWMDVVQLINIGSVHIMSKIKLINFFLN